MAADLGHRTEPDNRWLWLIHDDSAPAPNALEELLGSVEISPSVTIAGCKQVRWDDTRKLIDVGLGMSPRAERLTMINQDELDQDQYNARSDVFAVNSAGMLIRADSWEELGGFDPALNMVGDDLDICWRNRLNGKRVIVVPTAIMRHDEPVQADTDRRSRPSSGPWLQRRSLKKRSSKLDEVTGRISPSGIRAQRRSQNYLQLKHAPAWKVPFLWVFLFVSAFVDLIVGIATKKITQSFKAWAGSLAGLFHPIRLARSRRQAKKTKRVGQDVIEPMITSRRELIEYRRANSAVVEPLPVIGDGTGVANSAQEPTGDRDEFTAIAAPERTWVGAGAVAVVAVLGIAGLILSRHLLGATALTGGSMLPVSTSLSAVFAHAASWWTDLSVGSSHHVDPFSYVLWFLGILGFGNASAATVWTLIVALPAAGLSAWLFTANVTDSRGIRILSGFFWALVPTLHVAIAQGRLGAVIFHVLLPLFALALIRAVGAGLDPKRYLDPIAMRRTEVEMVLKPGINSVPSWTAAGSASLLLAVLAASAPAATLPLAIAVLLMFVLIGRRAKTLWFVPLPAIALFLPVWIVDWANPRALLGDPGLPQAFTAGAWWQQLLGHPVAFDPGATTPLFADWAPQGPWALTLALVFMVPAIVGLIVALFIPGLRGNIVRFALLTAIVVLGFAFLISGIVTASDAGQPVTVFPGPALSVWVLVLLLGAIVTGDALGQARNASTNGRRNLLTGLTGVLLGAMTLSVLAAGAHIGTTSFLGQRLTTGEQANHVTTFDMLPLTRPSGERLIPATAADQALGQYRTRTLRITATSSGFDGALINGAATTLDALSAGHQARQFSGDLFEARWAPNDPADEHIKSAVAQIVAGDNLDPREELNELAAAFVFLVDPHNDQQLLAAKIDAVPGLAPVGETAGGWLWRAVPEETLPDADAATDFTSRMRVVDEDGATLQRIPSTLTDARIDLEAHDGERTLVIANRAHPDWNVTFDGEPLNQQVVNTAEGQWAATFELPEEAGELVVDYQHQYETAAVIGQALVFFIAILLAVPIPARSRVVPQLPPAAKPKKNKKRSGDEVKQA